MQPSVYAIVPYAISLSPDIFIIGVLSLSHKKLTNYSQIFFSHSIVTDQFLMAQNLLKNNH